METVTYTGKVGDDVKKSDTEVTIKQRSMEEVTLNVSWDEYSPRLLDQCAFNISCLATVHETNFEYYAQDDFRVRKPDIKIKVKNKKYLFLLGISTSLTANFTSSNTEGIAFLVRVSEKSSIRAIPKSVS